MYRKYPFFIILLLAVNTSFASSYIVLSSTDSTIKENIDIADLRDIFLGNRVFWRNGERIFPAHIQKEQKQMKRFLKEVLSMSPRKFNKYWRRRLFSGKGHPPIEIHSDIKTIDYVKKTIGSIGIIGTKPKVFGENLHYFKASRDGHSLLPLKKR
jgi:hypothetical protein